MSILNPRPSDYKADVLPPCPLRFSESFTIIINSRLFILTDLHYHHAILLPFNTRDYTDKSEDIFLGKYIFYCEYYISLMYIFLSSPGHVNNLVRTA